MGVYGFSNVNFNSRLQELDEEEARMKKYLDENVGSITQDEIDRIQQKIVGIRSEAQEISMLLSGGFY